MYLVTPQSGSAPIEHVPGDPAIWISTCRTCTLWSRSLDQHLRACTCSLLHCRPHVVIPHIIGCNCNMDMCYHPPPPTIVLSARLKNLWKPLHHNVRLLIFWSEEFYPALPTDTEIIPFRHVYTKKACIQDWSQFVALRTPTLKKTEKCVVYNEALVEMTLSSDVRCL